MERILTFCFVGVASQAPKSGPKLTDLPQKYADSFAPIRIYLRLEFVQYADPSV